jgi:prepilin-type N-terminal cleavage/methylation domain-containing protein
MKNLINKRKKNQTGFTLLELVVVVAVMGLISSMAMDVYTDNSNQKRFEATKERLAEIKFAIIGDPMMRVGSQAILTGYYNDMILPPSNLKDLINDPTPDTKGECFDISKVITSDTNKTTCEATSVNTWVSDWQGPYLHNLQTFFDDKNTPNDESDDVTRLVFSDAWGNHDASDTDDFGWGFDDSTGDLTVTSAGLNRSFSSSDLGYEEDKSTTIYATELAYIDNLKSLNTGYCIEKITFKIKPLMDKTSCDAVPTTHKWAAFP